MTDAPHAPMAAAPPRSKVELLYQEILRESHQLVAHIERVTQRQEDMQQSLQTLPTMIRQAVQDAATHASDNAARALLEASRTLGKSATDARIATRVATKALPATAWRAGLLCAFAALIGSVLGAAVTLSLF